MTHPHPVPVVTVLVQSGRIGDGVLSSRGSAWHSSQEEEKEEDHEVLWHGLVAPALTIIPVACSAPAFSRSHAMSCRHSGALPPDSVPLSLEYMPLTRA